MIIYEPFCLKPNLYKLRKTLGPFMATRFVRSAISNTTRAMLITQVLWMLHKKYSTFISAKMMMRSRCADVLQYMTQMERIYVCVCDSKISRSLPKELNLLFWSVNENMKTMSIIWIEKQNKWQYASQHTLFSISSQLKDAN